MIHSHVGSQVGDVVWVPLALCTEISTVVVVVVTIDRCGGISDGSGDMA